MKRFITLLLAAMMLLSLCGCAKKPEDMHIEYCDERVKKLELDIDGEYDEDELTLVAVLEPEEAEGKVEWESYDEDILEISDNGDGSCELELVAPGETTVVADCGEVSARVKITVNEVKLLCDWDAYERTEYEQPQREFTAESSSNKAKLKFTANDVYSSGIMNSDAPYKDMYLPHYEAISSGTADGALFSGDRAVHYAMENHLFTGFATLYNDMTVAYTPVYENGFITGMTADFGDDNITQISFEHTEDGMAVKLSGYGGEQESRNKDTVCGVEKEKGGFTASVTGDEIGIRLGSVGAYDDNDMSAYVFLDYSDSDQGFYIYQLNLYDGRTDSDLIIRSYNRTDFSDPSYEIETHPLINGLSCSVSFRDDDDYFYVFITNSASSYDSLSYYFNHDGTFSSGSCFRIKNGGLDYLTLDEKGNITN